MTTKKARLEVQIRQNSTDVSTDDPSSVADVTVLEDTFDGKMRGIRANDFRAYVDDDHDEAIDVELQHTHSKDEDFSATLTANTISLTSGQDQGTATLQSPVGLLRLVILASEATAAPTTGSMIVEIVAHG